jgi:hypothetical protein
MTVQKTKNSEKKTPQKTGTRPKGAEAQQPPRPVEPKQLGSIFSKADFDSSKIYNKYLVTIRVRDRVLGGVPKNPDKLNEWVRSRMQIKEPDEESERATREVMETLNEPTEESSWCCFQSDEQGLFVAAMNVKAMLKTVAQLLGWYTKKMGLRPFTQHFGLEVKGEDGSMRIRMKRSTLSGQTVVQEPDGDLEGLVHLNTKSGPRSALRRQDYVDKPIISFQVWLMKTSNSEKRHISEEELKKWLCAAQEEGFSATRSQGHGKFDVIGLERI